MSKQSAENVAGCPLGGPRCPESICDCFIDTHPESPLALHPEDFLVKGHRYDLDGHMADCPGCVTPPGSTAAQTHQLDATEQREKP